MIAVDEKEITEVFIGTQGIKAVIVGGDPVYERKGGYIYLVLDTKS